MKFGFRCTDNTEKQNAIPTAQTSSSVPATRRSILHAASSDRIPLTRVDFGVGISRHVVLDGLHGDHGSVVDASKDVRRQSFRLIGDEMLIASRSHQCHQCHQCHQMPRVLRLTIGKFVSIANCLRCATSFLHGGCSDHLRGLFAYQASSDTLQVESLFLPDEPACGPRSRNLAQERTAFRTNLIAFGLLVKSASIDHNQLQWLCTSDQSVWQHRVSSKHCPSAADSLQFPNHPRGRRQ